jgi:hypothetical protein
MRNAGSTVAIATCLSSMILYNLLVYFFSIKVSPFTILVSKSFSTQPPTSQKGNSNMTVDLSWYPPNSTWITNLTDVINGTGTHGFIFNGDEVRQYGGYNWCNMPHVREQEYVRVDKEFELVYVEVVSLALSLLCWTSSCSGYITFRLLE